MVFKKALIITLHRVTAGNNVILHLLSMFKHQKKTMVKFITQLEMVTLQRKLLQKKVLLNSMCEHRAASMICFFFFQCVWSMERKPNKSLGTLDFAQGSVITWGTHFEETKLVASTAGRPVPESMSISWIFTPVGTISQEAVKMKHTLWTQSPPKKNCCVHCGNFSNIELVNVLEFTCPKTQISSQQNGFES